MRILITRPREDADSFAASLAARGIDVAVEPLLTIQPVPNPPIDLGNVQAVLFTSANGARCFAAAEARRDIKVFTVGDGSATTARALGFTDIESAAGDVTSLATLVADRLKAGDGALLHAAGSSLAGDLKGQLEAAGFTVRRVTLYDAVPASELPPGTLMNLRLGGIDAVALFSPRSARTFVDLWRKAGGAKDGLKDVTALCLSAAVARELKDLDWRRVEIAAQPDIAALLALVDAEQKRRETEMSHPATEGKDGRAPGTAAEIDEKTRAAAASDAVAGAAIVAAMPKPASTGRGGALVLGLIAGAVAGAGMVVAEPYWRPYLPIAAVPATDANALTALQADVAALKDALGNREAVDSEARHDIEALQSEITSWKDQLAQATGNTANTATPLDLGPIEMRLAALEDQLKNLPAPEAAAAASTSDATSAAMPEVPAADVSALTARIAELEGKFAALGDTTTRLDFLSNETAAQKAQIETTKAKLDNVSALGDRLTALETQAKSLGVDLGNLSQENAEAGFKRQRAAALVLTVGQLRAALGSEAPFAAELAATEDLGRADADLAARLAPTLGALKPFANDGAPTLAQLQAAFPAEKIAQGAAADTAGESVGIETSWLQKTFARLSELVTVRPVGEVEGDGALAHLARGEARLSSGDLAGAAAEIKALTGQAGEAAKVWLSQAEARLAVDAAGADLAVISAEALAPAVGAPAAEPSN
ncbi:uroporphyrinogen-III synthase [Dongia rigui]|uniref:Uroporphyrinogen-III synthase n=1 Tax=Dongia rigui TaxID=940149 RepID=A0ABU5DVZ7_9PROT|nr:uroporphyrinogen-III synthase [Dongia rigui]MDY0871115.1 uroporphyrinogen-III synthase [Dongia rigui]